MAKLTNEQKYKTPEERIKAFIAFCKNKKECDHDSVRRDCPKLKCMMEWLALEAEEEKPEPMPCPFCGGECLTSNAVGGKWRVFCEKDMTCLYSSGTFFTESEALAAHNRVCKAVKDFPVLEKMKIELLNIAHNGSKTTVAEIVEKYLALGTQERTVG